MGEKTGISWTDSTFIPWEGCTKVSPGCKFCYAEVQSKKFGKDVWGAGKPRQRTTPKHWRKPVTWNQMAEKAGNRHKVFCSSMSDWLDIEIPATWVADMLNLILITPHLDWQLLTKRPENWRVVLERVWNLFEDPAYKDANPALQNMLKGWLFDSVPPYNVWLGTSVENQACADARVPLLSAMPAKVRFLSCEPLLEKVTLNLAGGAITWVIVGGESGENARPFDTDWADSIVRQCETYAVACFVKQMGDNPYKVVYDSEECGGAPMSRPVAETLFLMAHHGADPSEWDETLRVRQFPKL